MSAAEVATQGYNYLAQILAQHDLCTACIKIVSRHDDYVENNKILLHVKNQFAPDRIKQITSGLVQQIIAKAKLTEKDAFSLLCGNTLVSLCGGLESLVKDVVAAELLDNPQLAVKNLGSRVFRFQASELLSRTEEEKARYIVDVLYRDEGAKHGRTQSFVRLFRYVDRDMEIKVTQDVINAIDEAWEIRNTIVHRGSRVDARLKRAIPHFEQGVGNPIELREPRFRRYRAAILKFAEKIDYWNL